MPFWSPADCSFKFIPQCILALPLHIEPQPLLIRNWYQAYLNTFACISFKDQKSDKKILEAYNKTYCVKSNTFSPYNWCVYSKSGSCVEVSFFIFRQFSLQAFKFFNSLGLSSGVPLISLTTTLPKPFLVLIQNDQVRFIIILQPFIPLIIPSKLTSST